VRRWCERASQAISAARLGAGAGDRVGREIEEIGTYLDSRKIANLIDRTYGIFHIDCHCIGREPAYLTPDYVPLCQRKLVTTWIFPRAEPATDGAMLGTGFTRPADKARSPGPSGRSWPVEPHTK